MKVNSFYLCHKFRIWLLYFRSYLLGIYDIKLSNLRQQYELGRLLTVYLDEKKFDKKEEVLQLHKNFFLKAKDLINSKNDDNSDNVKAIYLEIKELSGEITSLISECENK